MCIFITICRKKYMDFCIYKQLTHFKTNAPIETSPSIKII
jgi:hypothetical protein